jgi:hypothetical protein
VHQVNDFKIFIKTNNGQNFILDASEVATDWANYVMEEEDELFPTTFEKEFAEAMDDKLGLARWLEDRMDWYRCKTLVELERDDERLHKLKVIELTVAPDWLK